MLNMTFDTEFPGGSAICSANGTELGRLGETEEGVLIRPGDLTKAAEPEVKPTIPRYWGGYTDGTPFLKVCLLFQYFGARYYNSSELRKQLAREAFETSTAQ